MAGFLTMRDIFVRLADAALASARRLVAEQEKRAVEPARGRDDLAKSTLANLAQAFKQGRAFIRAGGLLAAAIPRVVVAPQPPRVPRPAAATIPAPTQTPVTPPGFKTPKAAPLRSPAVTTGGDPRVQPGLPGSSSPGDGGADLGALYLAQSTDAPTAVGAQAAAVGLAAGATLGGNDSVPVDLTLAVLVQVNAGVFQLVHRPEHRMPFEVLLYLAVKGHANCHEEDYLQFLLDNEMLFDCTLDWSQCDPTREYVRNMFWDEYVEAQERHRQGVPVSSADYHYDMDVEALLELGVLTEVEKGLFFSASRSRTLRIDPARKGRIARQMHEDGSATAVLRHLAKFDVLFACRDPAGGANMWMDRKYYFAHLVPASLLGGGASVSEARTLTADMPSDETRRSWRDGHQAALNLAPRARYTYPPHLLALLELGYLMEEHKGIFERQNVPSQRFVHPLRGQLARECAGAQRQSEDELLQELLNDGVLFDCKGDSKFDLF
ncbi:hypothetical protein KFL_008720030 [Klebsormidium nitens]|uniref:Uncharacterized protein n=1 Tax=Klebsormidium nitens TaxID=105231 RepID=A0A1Y1IUH2_KLENI|nr:hypothetical protein KFL_008720030 [Klebsormidium nitens]|eukprot:GAQ91868.1 hypothetical protein KFL_008720030 [Klebsormidium nitens]